MDGYEPPGLQVDDHLAGPMTLGNPQGQVNLADQDQPVVAQLGPDTALSHRSPCGFEVGPAFDELAHRVDRLRPQIGPVSLATAAQPVAEVARVSFEAGQGLVDQDRRFLLAPPVDRQFDRFVDDGSPGQRHTPFEGAGLLGQEARFATVHHGQAVLGHEEVLAVGKGI